MNAIYAVLPMRCPCGAACGDGELVDPGKIGRAAQRILGASPVARLFDIEIGRGRFLYHYDEAAFVYEDSSPAATCSAPASPRPRPQPPRWSWPTGRWSRSSAASGCSRTSCTCARWHWTEPRVRAHVAVCVYATVIEALMARALHDADVRDPDLPDQRLSAERALRELGRIRAVTLTAGERTIDVVTRRSPLQSRILAALGVDTSGWERPRIS